jgi:spore germination protein
MKKILFVLAYSVVVLAVFSIGKVTENNQLSIALSGQYAKEMTDASEKLGELDTAVKKTLLFNASDGSSKAREDIWRLSSDIKNSVSSLPLDQSFSTSWLNYLGRLGNYAKQAERIEDHAEYHKVMMRASENLGVLSEEWQIATSGMVGGKLSIGDWVNQLDSTKSEHDWSGMGTTVKQYTESDFPLTASESDSMKKKDLKHMEDAKVSKEEAIARFKKLFPTVSSDVIGIESSKPGSPYPFYHIRFSDENAIGYIDITEKGGHVLSYLAERSFSSEVMPFEELEKKAKRFLKDEGYTDLELEESRENHSAWHMVFVRIEPEYKAKVFSDTIHLKIAKDNGEIIGLDASEYIRKEKTKTQPMKKLDWSVFFHKDVKIINEELAYVENDQLDQRLAYYLTVTKEEHGEIGTYAVIIDTETSEVIKTEKQN